MPWRMPIKRPLKSAPPRFAGMEGPHMPTEPATETEMHTGDKPLRKTKTWRSELRSRIKKKKKAKGKTKRGW